VRPPPRIVHWDAAQRPLPRRTKQRARRHDRFTRRLDPGPFVVVGSWSDRRRSLAFPYLSRCCDWHYGEPVAAPCLSPHVRDESPLRSVPSLLPSPSARTLPYLLRPVAQASNASHAFGQFSLSYFRIECFPAPSSQPWRTSKQRRGLHPWRCPRRLQGGPRSRR
jgi:hypothetical protein